MDESRKIYFSEIGNKFNDLSNAERFAEYTKGKICYTNGHGFMQNNDLYFETANKSKLYSICSEIIKEMELELKYYVSEEQKNAMQNFINKTKNEHSINAMIELSKQYNNISDSEFDSNKLSINLLNGEYDLLNDKFSYKRTSLYTKIFNVEYKEDAVCKLWGNYLNEIFLGDNNLIEFIQTICGYFLTGQNNEPYLYIFFGHGRNGKSVFVNVLASLFNTYSTFVRSAILAKKRFDTNLSEIAQLFSVRLAIANEVNPEMVIDEEILKVLTSREKITARYLYKEPFQFEPSHKLILVCNQLPQIENGDFGVWRRICAIPFKYTIPINKIDIKLQEKLLLESSGILNWLIIGHIKYKINGIVFPDSVSNLNTEYKRENSTVDEFILQYYDKNENKTYELLDDLFEHYVSIFNDKVLTKRKFSLLLQNTGLIKHHTRDGMAFYGIKRKE